MTLAMELAGKPCREVTATMEEEGVAGKEESAPVLQAGCLRGLKRGRGQELLCLRYKASLERLVIVRPPRVLGQNRNAALKFSQRPASRSLNKQGSLM